MPTIIPRKPYERHLWKKKLLHMRDSSDNTQITTAKHRQGKSQLSLSPKTITRADILKRRFASTILMDQQTLCKNDKSYGGLIKITVAAPKAKIKTSAELRVKKERQKEREEARLALEKMEVEASVEIEDNFKIMREFETLCGMSPYTRPLLLQDLGLGLSLRYEGDDFEEILDIEK